MHRLEPVRGHFNRKSAHFAALLRTILPTWIEYEDKLKEKWNDGIWEEEISKTFEEYALEGDHEQSPLDNSLNRADDIIRLIEEKYHVREVSYSDAFMDKIIGGLRGEMKYELGCFLSFMDQYMVKKGLLPPTSIELIAEKKE